MADIELHFISLYPPGPVRTFATKLLNEISCAVQTEAYVIAIAECCGVEQEDRERVISRACDCRLIKPELLEWYKRGRTHYIPCFASVAP